MKLTPEQETLLNTEFPAEIEKQAAEEVAAARDLYAMGFDKMASQAADALDTEVVEEESEKVACDDEMEKAAQDRAAFIARGYIDGLMKEGSARHNDELHYLYPFIAEKLAMDASKLKGFFNSAKNKVIGRGKQLASDVNKVAKGVDRHGNKLDAASRAKAALRPAAAVTAVGGAAALASKKKEK